MRVLILEVHRFRGIAHLKCSLDVPLLCLVGEGDSCKTTILDALELVLLPRWNVQLTDVDFFEGDPSEGLTIRVTLAEPPTELLSDAKFGLEARGWSPSGELHDEPEDEDQRVLTVEFSADESLEPVWRVVNDRRPEGRPISARDRALFGLARLGGDPSYHLSWARGSALASATADPDEIGRVLANATRRVRDAAKEVGLAELDGAVEMAREGGRALGSGDVTDLLEAGIDIRSLGARSSAISLHARDLPVSTHGAGTRRLLALGLQQSGISETGLVLVDEVELALEPHRLRHLLRALRSLTGEPGDAGGGRLVILTTHSPVVLEELRAEELGVVRRGSGNVDVHRCTADLQSTLRGSPEAFLARRILVCEGKTELGLCRALESRWAKRHDDTPVAHTGTAFALGGGSEAPSRVARFRKLGYECALFADSDAPLAPTREELEGAGIMVAQWGGSVSTEERIALDLPLETVAAIVEWRQGDEDPDAVAESILSRVGSGISQAGSAPRDWIGEIEEGELRRAFGEAAKRNHWFKRIDLGEELGEIVSRALVEIEDADLARKLNDIERWIYS